MKYILAIVLSLIVSTAMAETNYFYYNQSTSNVLIQSSTLIVDMDSDAVSFGDSGVVSGVDWTKMAVASSTDSLGTNKISNLSQLQSWTPIDLKDERANIAKMQAKMRLVIRALVLAINERLPAGSKITEAELRQKIKDQM